MTSVICDSCGTKCEVPFKPTSDKPIYCKECFGGKDNERTSKGTVTVKTVPNKDLDIINEKLNKIMKALEIE
jgi:CxxC-x17-CxxC domain-containing protein